MTFSFSHREKLYVWWIDKRTFESRRICFARTSSSGIGQLHPPLHPSLPRVPLDLEWKIAVINAQMKLAVLPAQVISRSNARLGRLSWITGAVTSFRFVRPTVTVSETIMIESVYFESHATFNGSRHFPNVIIRIVIDGDRLGDSREWKQTENSP